MARRKAEVAITCNIRQAKQAQKILISTLESLKKEYDQLVAAGRQNDAETQKMKKNMDALSSAVATNQQNMNRIKQVMDNLSGSTLKQLNSALREVKKQLGGKSSDSADLAKLQSQYNAITEQIKKLKGETIDVAKGVRTLSDQTDAWLTKAIAKQKELVGQTRRSSHEYQTQSAILKQLTAEQNRRTSRAIKTRAGEAVAIAKNPAMATMGELRSARQNLVAYRDNIGASGSHYGSAENNAAKIKEINSYLAAIDKQMEAINGKEQQVSMTAQQIVQSVRQIDFSKATPNQLKAKLDEVNNALANMGKNDPMRNHLLQSARQLQQALSSINGEVVNVKGVLANLDKASPQKLKAALDQVNRSLERMGQKSDKRALLVSQAEQLRTALAKVDKKAVDVDRVLRNLKTTPLRDLKQAAAQLEKEMEMLNRKTTEYVSKQKQLKTVRTEIERTNKSVGAQASAWQKTFQAIGAYMGVTMIIGKIQQMVSNVIKGNLKLSDQLANIRKVSMLTMKDINALSESLAGLDTRTKLTELNDIAYAGAKLGIGKYGPEALAGFTRAANQVNVALKEDLGEDALTALSKITETMGLIPKMGVEKSMLATGSAMFMLSSTSTATSNNIVEFAKRLTGMARTAGLTTDQLLALGSASDSMYLMPEVSATAFNKLITAIQKNHNLIEDSLKIDKGTIDQLFSAGRIIDAIVLIFEKMQGKNMNALSPIFKDLGSDGARLVNVMVTMSRNVDMLKEHLETSEDAFYDAMAVTREYNIQQETAAALMERANNVWTKAFINTEGVDNVKSMAQQWYKISNDLVNSPQYINQLKFALGSVITAIKMLIYLMPSLLTFFMFKGAAATIRGLVSGVMALITSVKAATTSVKLLNVTLSSNVIGAVAALIMILVSAFQSLTAKGKETVSMQNDLKNAIAGTSSEVMKASEKLKAYLNVLESVGNNEEVRTRIIRRFNKEYSPYLKKLGIEVSNVKDLKDNYKKLNEEIAKKLWYQAREASYEKHLKDSASQLDDKRIDIYDNLKSVGLFSVFSVKDITDAADALGGDYAYRSLLNQAAGGSAVTLKANDRESGGKKDYTGYVAPDGYWHRTGYYYYTDEDGKKQRFPYTYLVNKDNDKVGFGDSYARMQMAMSSYSDVSSDYNATKSKIDEIYEPYIGDYNPFVEEDYGHLDNDAPDKDAIRKQKELEAHLRDELRSYLDQLKAWLTNIRNYYERQITEVYRQANEEGWDDSYLTAAVDHYQKRMRIALSQAKGAITLGGDWQIIGGRLMPKDKIEGPDAYGFDYSQMLIDDVSAVNVGELSDKVRELATELNMRPQSTFADLMKSATLDEKSNETAENRALKERQKLAVENNATGKVRREYTQSLTKLGFFNAPGYKKDVPYSFDASFATRQAEIEDLLDRVEAEIVDIYAVGDVATDEGKNRLLTILFGENWRTDVKEITNICDLSGEEMKLFYSQLIGYYDDYVEAQKRVVDRQKKLLNFRWDRSKTNADYKEQTRTDSLYQKGLLQHVDYKEYKDRSAFGVYGNTRFMSPFGADPEIEALKTKMELEEARMEFLRANTEEEQILAEQQEAVYEAQAEYISGIVSRVKSQMDEVLALTSPVDDFGSKMGEAFAMMSQDADAARDMIQAAIGDMIKDFMKQTVEMTKEYIKRRLMQKMHDRLVQMQLKKESKVEANLEEKKQDDVNAVAEVGGQAKTMLTEEVGNEVKEATAKVGDEALQIQQEQTQQEVQTESAKTQANTTMGIASGAAKIIGSLGWWGIPLVAVITALLNGLLSFAMSKVTSLFGGGKGSSSSSGPQTKLVTGMLTYDKGNVQSFRGVIDGKSYPVVGDDGRVYAATNSKKLETGLVEDPITTLINGQPALVAERGPEIVIGRETTAAMMMARPDILAEIVKFDKLRSGRTYRAYDGGNVGDLDVSVLGGENDPRLREAIDALTLVLATIQREGIQARINKYGRGGVTDAARSGGKFMQRNSGDPLWRS